MVTSGKFWFRLLSVNEENSGNISIALAALSVYSDIKKQIIY